MSVKEMTVTSSDRQTSQLDRRRDQAGSATSAAEKAQAGVTDLDNRLRTNTSMTQQQKQALRNAEAEVNRLKRSLKAAAKERDRLSTARKKATVKADKARAKAEAAEAKYDKSVLADLVRREKIKDRADSARPPAKSSSKALQPVPERSPVPATPAPAGETSGAQGRRSRTAAAKPPPERPDAGATAATRTAARKTAATRTAARKTAASAGVRGSRAARSTGSTRTS
jgi:chromosome segregation ATPase